MLKPDENSPGFELVGVVVKNGGQEPVGLSGWIRGSNRWGDPSAFVGIREEYSDAGVRGRRRGDGCGKDLGLGPPEVFIEKILRVQPNVKKLFLLLRAADNDSALHRFNNEVMAKDLFKVVKEKYGPKLESLIQDKITVIAGDITCDYMGLNGSILEELYEQVEIVVNLAATTDFDARE
ncbi:Fatty acyl-CoA reductase 3 [Striga hermonthica]|uniref:Fatty acyl-CoA reductase n=1 Tax=Striga hermonthica TaxID=68872 RepID=A0A9N7R4I8_STRHE|nr:Fatty acyl-CoA reductase 3 [Striga hermonthica]